MTEKLLRKHVIKLLSPLCAFAVENEVIDGTPDVCTIVGWIELKVAKFPARPSSVLKVKVRKGQRIWLHRWYRHGGNAWTITVVDSQWFLHNGRWSHQFLGVASEESFRNGAENHWNKMPSSEELVRALVESVRKKKHGP